jgi:hypothetical protein
VRSPRNYQPPHIPRNDRPLITLTVRPLCSVACKIPLRLAAGSTDALNEPSCFSALFAQITFPKEYEVVLEPALK